MEENDWAKVLQKETDLDDNLSDYETVQFAEGREKYVDYRQGAHVMIWAKDDGMLWNKNRKHAAVMMQVRFDGKFGFPGGLLDKGPHEDPVTALNRELEEEIGLDLKSYKVKQENHIISHVNHGKRLLLHFYAMQLELADVHKIEINSTSAMEWGAETLGMTRIPLFLFENGNRGFPTFLTNRFAGSCKIQLIHTIQKLNIVSPQHLNDLMSAYVKYTAVHVKDSER